VLEVDVGGARTESAGSPDRPHVFARPYNISFEELIVRSTANKPLIAACAIENGAGRLSAGKVPRSDRMAKTVMALPVKVRGDTVR